MGLDTAQEIRWLRSRPADTAIDSERIDAEQGIIHDVVMVQEGEAKGHEVHLDGDFIADILAYDLRHYAVRGLKARFGHPSASNETMGTQMGVFKNFRLRERKGKKEEIADLHLLEAADDSPTHPGMRSWMLKMAAENPALLMSSIVFRPGAYFQMNEEGKKVYINSPYGANQKYGKVFVEFGKKGEHYATDIVEEGAATDNLFSTKVNPDFFVSRAHQWLDDNPDILDFVKANPQRVQFFLQRLGISIQQPTQKKMAKTSLLDWLFGKADEKPEETPAEELDTLKTELMQAKEQFTALQSEKDALDNRVKTFEQEVASLQANVAQLKKDAEALQTDLDAKVAEIAALKAEPAALHTGGETEPGAGGGKKSKTQELYDRYGIK